MLETLTIDPSQIDAFLMDLDGTQVITDKLQFYAWQKACEVQGRQYVDFDMHRSFGSASRAEITKRLIEMGVNVDPQLYIYL